jgi:hypothetical protein
MFGSQSVRRQAPQRHAKKATLSVKVLPARQLKIRFSRSAAMHATPCLDCTRELRIFPIDRIAESRNYNVVVERERRLEFKLHPGLQDRGVIVTEDFLGCGVRG